MSHAEILEILLDLMANGPEQVQISLHLHHQPRENQLTAMLFKDGGIQVLLLIAKQGKLRPPSQSEHMQQSNLHDLLMWQHTRLLLKLLQQC